MQTMRSTDIAGEMQHKGGKFTPGVSGNPAGKPKGCRSKYSLAAEALLDGEAEKLTRKCIQAALKGDMQAMRLCIERIIPPRKDMPVKLKLPAVLSSKGLVDASQRVLAAVGKGEITPLEGAAVAQLLEGHRRFVEQEEILKRIEALEGQNAATPG
jgi:hypothetical protein